MISRGRHTTGAALFTLALTAAGCLTASSESRVQTDLDQVKKQMFEMQRDTAAMMAKVTSIDERLAKPDTSQPAHWADLQTLLQTLTDEVRTLGARLDDNAVRMGNLGRDIAATRDQYRALDARIAAALGEKAPALPASLEPLGAGAAQGAPSPAGTAVVPIPGAGAQGPPPGGTASPAGSPTADESAQEEVFRAAYSDFTRGNYDLALTGFQVFLKQYPGSALAAGAQYYSGECLFSQQKYQEAADAFGKAVADHPNMDNAAAAYLKRGLSLLALKQTAQGVVQLQHVIDAYPRSEEARIAADRLRQLGLRDH